MTIRRQIESELERNGLWPDEAKKVVSALESDKICDAIRGRFDEDTTAYPIHLVSILMLGAKRKAIEWIDANVPQHLARELLTT